MWTAIESRGCPARDTVPLTLTGTVLRTTGSTEVGSAHAVDVRTSASARSILFISTASGREEITPKVPNDDRALSP
jgi:hypothetical protein